MSHERIVYTDADCAELQETNARLTARVAELEAQNARLIEALTPSGVTKAEYSGEFAFGVPTLDENGDEVLETHRVPWTIIKDIMAAIRARAALAGGAK